VRERARERKKDIHTERKRLIIQAGETLIIQAGEKLFMKYGPNEKQNNPSGKKMGDHLNAEGAYYAKYYSQLGPYYTEKMFFGF
jgi:hypothetical protein